MANDLGLLPTGYKTYDVYEGVSRTLELIDWGANTLPEVKEAAARQVARLAMFEALKQVGLEDLDFQRTYTKEDIGAIIGKMVQKQTGVYVGNVFDKDGVKAALTQYACKVAIEQMGVDQPQTVAGVGAGLAQLAMREIGLDLSDVAGGGIGGQFVQAAKARNFFAGMLAKDQVITAAGKARQAPVKMDARSVDNRRRQAEWRATHNKYWIPIPGAGRVKGAGLANQMLQKAQQLKATRASRINFLKPKARAS